MLNQVNTKELKFYNIGLSKDIFIEDFLIVIGLLTVLPSLLILIVDLNIAVAISSFTMLLRWKSINNLIYYFFYGNITVYQPYFNEPSDYYETEISLKDEVVEHLYSKKNEYDNTKKYYLGTTEDNSDTKSLFELLSFNYNFENQGKTNLFFIISLFFMNFLYAVMILCAIDFVTGYKKEWVAYKEILLIGLVIVFGITIIKLVIDSFPSNTSLKDILKDTKLLARLKDTEILEVVSNKEVEELKIEKIEKLYKIRTRSIEKIKSSIFQIMTPIFFLSYVTIIISYCK